MTSKSTNAATKKASKKGTPAKAPGDDAAVSLEKYRLDDVGFDPFGYDPTFEERAAPSLDGLMDRFFRLQPEGTENLSADVLPERNRVIFVANHGGALPWDAVMLRWALKRLSFETRPLLEDPVMTAPFVGKTLTRLGCIRASQENAMRAMARDESIAVFPEGAQGLGKLYRHRNRLQRFGRGGFVRLALKTRATLVPVALVGPEDSSPLLTKWRLLFKGTSTDYLPVTPTFPLLGPAGLIPLPARWFMRFGAPIRVFESLSDDADRVETMEVATKVRDLIQRDVEELAQRRTSIWRG